MRRQMQGLLNTQHFPHEKMAFLVGPRQVGKTTLSEALLKERHSQDLYRNWDDLAFRRQVTRQPYQFVDDYRPTGAVKPLVVLDEIHKFPRWKQYLKGLWDTRKKRFDVMVTGSGRLDVYQRGGDSLLGRYHQYRLHPLSVAEVIDPLDVPTVYDPEDTILKWRSASGKPKKEWVNACTRLLKWGGFPSPFVERDERQLRLWHKERRQLLIREDLRDISHIQSISHVEALAEMLVDRAGGILSYNSLREDLQVALDSVRLWTDYLRRLYFVYLVRPYAKGIARAIRREPKVYLWDWSEVADEGGRFENMIAGHLLKWVHFCQDWGHPVLELHYVRDKEKREVDFLITRDEKPWLLIEVKLSRENLSPALHYFSEKLKVPHMIQVVQNLAQPGMSGNVMVLDAATFCAKLPV